MNPKLKAIFIVLPFFLFLSSPVLAKKKLVRYSNPSSTSTTHPQSAWVKPKFRADRQAILLVIGGMEYADSFTYNLTYSSDGIGQGVQGSHQPEQGNTQKEIIFGTCSAGVCSYHADPQDMILEIVSQLKTGKTLTQKYRLNP